MAAQLRVLGCLMTLTAMLAPWAAVVRTAVHLAFDAHHHEEASPTPDDLHDAATVLHGHGHEHGTPAHSHDATVAQAPQAPLPSLTIHPSVPAFACAAIAADAAVLLRYLDPSPPPRAPIILRI